MNYSNSKEKKNLARSLFRDVGERLRSLDHFDSSVPAFNLGGKERIKTRLGGLVSFGIMYTTFIFALLKMKHLQEYKSPSITSYKQSVDTDYRLTTSRDAF